MMACATTATRVPLAHQACLGLPCKVASTKQLRPLGDRVVVEPTPHDEMTKSGILIPDTVKEKPQKGTIWRSARVGSWTTGSASRSM